MGFIGKNPTNKFATWTRVILLNCDGSAFQGNNKEVVSHNGTKLYFRGSVNMRAHFRLLNLKFNLQSA